MNTTDTSPNAAQIDSWNRTAGVTWVEFHAQLDAQIRPFGVPALARLDVRAGKTLIDIGCGCGDTTLELARRVGPAGGVVGVDISQPMLVVARRRAHAEGLVQARFVEADAQEADLGVAVYDAAYSRFGVMFFSDPVRAFANLRKALKPGAPLGFVCWRGAAENPWMWAPLEAARPHLPPIPPSDPLAPGPVAFADPERVRHILGGAGFTDIGIDRHDGLMGEQDLEETTELGLRIGPLGAFLRERPEFREVVRGAVRAAFTEHLVDGIVRIPAATWVVHASA